MRWACSMGSEDCQKKTGEKFSEWMDMVEPDEEEKNP